MIYARLFETIAILFTRRGILLTRLVESYALRVGRSAFSVALVIDWRTTGEYQSSQLLIGMLLWIMMEGGHVDHDYHILCITWLP